MSDEIRELREAIEWWDVDPKEVGENPYRDSLLAAARSYLRILEEGREVWWCEEHRTVTVPGVTDRCNRVEWMDHLKRAPHYRPCRLVRMRLTPIDPAERESEK